MRKMRYVPGTEWCIENKRFIVLDVWDEWIELECDHCYETFVIAYRVFQNWNKKNRLPGYDTPNRHLCPGEDAYQPLVYSFLDYDLQVVDRPTKAKTQYYELECQCCYESFVVTAATAHNWVNKGRPRHKCTKIPTLWEKVSDTEWECDACGHRVGTEPTEECTHEHRVFMEYYNPLDSEGQYDILPIPEEF